MIYKTFKDVQLSALGMGCMRFPGDGGAFIEETETEKMIDYAMEKGINYYDTAWGYHEGNSEVVMGRCLKKYPRESYYVADKFPGYDLSNMDKVEEVFEAQLKRLELDYFDFYLLHNVCEVNIEGYMNEAFGVIPYLLEQKKKGRIRHFGFSSHGRVETMKRFLEAYGNEMEFCMLQLNWVDWEFQKGREKVELLKEYQIPVWVMEPLRGGSLAKLSKENERKLLTLRPEETNVTWAYRFLQTIPEVTVTLTGASSLQQLKENIQAFEEEKPLNEREMEVLLEMAAEMTQGVPCTACRYCTTYCPQKLDIPLLLNLYNEHKFSGGGFIAPFALSALAEEKQPSACTKCGSCEAVCPQQIKISKELEAFSEMLKAE